MSKKTINPRDEGELQGGGKETAAHVQSTKDMAPEVEKVEEKKPAKLSDKEIIAAARKGEQLSAEDHERLRFIPGPTGEKSGYQDLWTKHELRYGEKAMIFIPLASGEKLERKDKDGQVSYPMEFVSISGVRCFVPKNRNVEVPKIVKDVLQPYVDSLHPVQHEMRNLSAPSFRFD